MYDVVNAVSMNDLSKEMFVFNVLEELMSRQMYGLAETIVACVGTGAADESDDDDDDDDGGGVYDDE